MPAATCSELPDYLVLSGVLADGGGTPIQGTAISKERIHGVRDGYLCAMVTSRVSGISGWPASSIWRSSLAARSASSVLKALPNALPPTRYVIGASTANVRVVFIGPGIFHPPPADAFLGVSLPFLGVSLPKFEHEPLHVHSVFDMHCTPVARKTVS